MSVDYTPQELARWCGGRWDPAPPDGVEGIIQDTRQLATGQVYVALRGAALDGHAFLDEAFRRGAAGAVIAEDAAWTPRRDAPVLRVAHTGRALMDMAAAYRRKLNPRIVAVTGSAGKSTTKELTARIASQCGPTARTRGNWNNNIGLPLSLLAMPADTRIGVFEVGMNHPGEIAELCRILKPDWGIVTTIGPVHLEFFKSVEDIADEKASLLRSLPADGLAILNRDTEFFDRLRAAHGGRARTVSLRGNADIVCVARRADRSEITVLEADSREQAVLRLPSVSEYNVTNALLAVAAGRELGLGWAAIQQGLDAYESLPMRWQEEAVRGVRVINDAYNANPLSMRVTLKALAEEPAAAGRRWLVLAGMLELGPTEREAHEQLGELVAAGPWAGVLTVGRAGEWIADGARRAGMDADCVVRCADNAAAADELKRRTAPGDTVLLKASRGMRLEEVIHRYKEQTP